MDIPVARSFRRRMELPMHLCPVSYHAMATGGDPDQTCIQIFSLRAQPRPTVYLSTRSLGRRDWETSSRPASNPLSRVLRLQSVSPGFKMVPARQTRHLEQKSRRAPLPLRAWNHVGSLGFQLFNGLGKLRACPFQMFPCQLPWGTHAHEAAVQQPWLPGLVSLPAGRCCHAYPLPNRGPRIGAGRFCFEAGQPAQSGYAATRRAETGMLSFAAFRVLAAIGCFHPRCLPCLSRVLTSSRLSILFRPHQGYRSSLLHALGSAY